MPPPNLYGGPQQQQQHPIYPPAPAPGVPPTSLLDQSSAALLGQIAMIQQLTPAAYAAIGQLPGAAPPTSGSWDAYGVPPPPPVPGTVAHGYYASSMAGYGSGGGYGSQEKHQAQGYGTGGGGSKKGASPAGGQKRYAPY